MMPIPGQPVAPSAMRSEQIATHARAAAGRPAAARRTDPPSGSRPGRAHDPARRCTPRVVAAGAAIALALAAAPLRAQQSANDELDQCMRDAALKGAAVGGGVGGLIGGLLGDNNRWTRALGGAAVGAAVGAAAAWQMSYKSCAARFATASSLVTEAYAACAQRAGYLRDAVRVDLDTPQVPQQVRGGQRLDTDVHYRVLTPDPKDVPLQLTRRFLCRDEQGRYNEIASPVERITVSAGCHVSRGSILLPTGIPAEQSCRIETVLEAEGETRSAAADFRILP